MGYYRVKGNDSLQSAFNNAEEGDTVWIHESYSATNDSWPVEMKHELRVVSSPHNTISLPSGATGGLFIHHEGPNRQPGANLVNVFIDANGAEYAFRIEDGRYMNFHGCIAESASHAGFWLQGDSTSPNSNTFFGCQAGFNSGNGFVTENLAHSTLFIGCRAVDNGAQGLWDQGSYATHLIGGQYEKNTYEGIYADGSESFSAHDLYVEDNAQNTSSGDQIQLDNCQASSIRDTYLNGMSSSDTNGIRFSSCNNCSMEHVEYRNLTSCVINQKSNYTDLRPFTHYSLDGTTFVGSDTGSNTKNFGTDYNP